MGKQKIMRKMFLFSPEMYSIVWKNLKTLLYDVKMENKVNLNIIQLSFVVSVLNKPMIRMWKQMNIQVCHMNMHTSRTNL